MITCDWLLNVWNDVWSNRNVFMCFSLNLMGFFFYIFILKHFEWELLGLSCFDVYFCFVWNIVDAWSVWVICTGFMKTHIFYCYLFKINMLKKVEEWSLTRFELTIGFTIPIAITTSWCLKVHLWMVHVGHRRHCVVVTFTELPRFCPHCKKKVLVNNETM